MISVSEFVGGVRWTMTQSFGRTPWSSGGGYALYLYGTSFCLPAGTHPGVDIGVSRGTNLYAPVAGKVIIAGGSPYFQDGQFGGMPQTGQLRIEISDGQHLIIGHMEQIAVWLNQALVEGQYVGRSGTNNGDHVHVEHRIPNAGCEAGFKCVDPMEQIFSKERRPQRLRLFRVMMDFVTIHDQPSLHSPSPGQYKAGEIAACNLVMQAQAVRPGEAAWGRLTGGRFAGQWIYLGFTREVRSGQDGIRYVVIDTSDLNVRPGPNSLQALLGAYQRGEVVPVGMTVQGEEVELGRAQWGQIAYGPFEHQWIYLGYTTELA